LILDIAALKGASKTKIILKWSLKLLFNSDLVVHVTRSSNITTNLIFNAVHGANIDRKNVPLPQQPLRHRCVAVAYFILESGR